jgi:hypothetical protein
MSRQTGPPGDCTHKSHSVTKFSKEYVVHVLTGDTTGAGTNVNVTIELIGSNRRSGERVLRHGNKPDAFERNQEDFFNLNVSVFVLCMYVCMCVYECQMHL